MLRGIANISLMPLKLANIAEVRGRNCYDWRQEAEVVSSLFWLYHWEWVAIHWCLAPTSAVFNRLVAVVACRWIEYSQNRGHTMLGSLEIRGHKVLLMVYLLRKTPKVTWWYSVKNRWSYKAHWLRQTHHLQQFIKISSRVTNTRILAILLLEITFRCH